MYNRNMTTCPICNCEITARDVENENAIFDAGLPIAHYGCWAAESAYADYLALEQSCENEYER